MNFVKRRLALSGKGFRPHEKLDGNTSIFYSALSHREVGMSEQLISTSIEEAVKCLNVNLMPFQREGVAWMIRRELMSQGGVLADHLGMGKTIQMIGLCLSNPLKILSLDRRFAMQVISTAGSSYSSRLQRMITVATLLQGTDGIGNCSRLIRPGMNLTEMRIKLNSMSEHTESDREAEAMQLLEPWLVYTKKMLPYFEKRCRMYIKEASSASSPNRIDTPELRTLIVAPASIILQWKNEIKERIRDNIGLKIFIYHGENIRISPEELETFDFVLTTYDTLVSHLRKGIGSSFAHNLKEEDQVVEEFPRNRCGPLFNMQWKRVILDEAHIIRHKKTMRWLAVKNLMSSKKWCVTATPLHNSLNDIQSLLTFVHAPELPISPNMDATIFLNDLVLQRSVARSLQEVFLRREPSRKAFDGSVIELVQLPKKYDNIVMCSLSISEATLYNNILSRYRTVLNSENALSVFTMLCRLRQVCCHPWLVDGVDLNVTESMCVYCQTVAEYPVTAPCGHVFCRVCLASLFAQSPAQANDNAEETRIRMLCPADTCDSILQSSLLHRVSTSSAERKLFLSSRPYESSSKINLLLNTLNNIILNFPNEKIVVFTHFTSFMDILELSLAREGLRFLRLDGSLTVESRAEVIRSFGVQNEFQILLASKMSSGVGLNLTMANHVIVLDPWWNPAIEEQAIHRCHRIGQTKVVHVHRFIIENSVEHMCLEISQRKKLLGDLILSSAVTGSMTKRGQDNELDTHLKTFLRKKLQMV